MSIIKVMKVINIILKLSLAILTVVALFVFFNETIKNQDRKIIANEESEWQEPKKTTVEVSFTDEETKDQEFLSSLPIKTIEKGSVRVPILLYHRIGIAPNPETQSYYVSPETFERQMHWLALNNYRIISLDSLVNYLKNGKNKPENKSVVITFDDGTIGQYKEAFPILKKYHYNATFFLVPTWIDKGSSDTGSDYMSWDQAKEISNYGMVIGSHNLTHKDMNNATDEEIITELQESKKILEEKLNKSIKNYAYPGGELGERSIKAVENYGYDSACSVQKDIDHNPAELFQLERMHIDNDLPYFIARIEGRWQK